MANTFKIPFLDHTSRDYTAIRNDLINLVRFFTDEWTDLNPSDFGIVLLELTAGVSDTLHYYVDRQALECFLPSAVKRESVISLLKLIDFEVPSAVSSTVNLEFTLPTPAFDPGGSPPTDDLDITVPKGTRVQTVADTPIIFETDADLVMPNEYLAANSDGTDKLSVSSSIEAAKYIPGMIVEISDTTTTAIQRTVLGTSGSQIQFTKTVPTGYDLIDDAYVAVVKATVGATEGKSDEEDAGLSDSSAFQKFKLKKKVIVDGTLKVFVDEGAGENEWDVVDSLFGLGPTTQKLTSSRNADDEVILEFGDSGSGKIPNSGATIRAEFRLGGGEVSNVGANTIKNVVSVVLDPLGSAVSPSVNNPSKASGGEDPMTIEEAKVQGPRSFRTFDRAVTILDYKVISETFPGVSKAQAVVKLGIVNTHIVPSGGGAPSLTLKANLLAELESKKCAGTAIAVLDPRFATITGVGTITHAPVFLTDEVEELVTDAIDAFFDPTTGSVDFGKTVLLTDFLCLLDVLRINNTDAIQRVSFNKFTRVPLPLLEVWSGDTTFSTVTITQTTIDEVWTVIFTSTTTFSVTGSVSGLQGNTGAINAAYASDNGQVSFTISSNTILNAPADRATFRTSEKFNDVEIDGDEFPLEGAFTLAYVAGT